MHFRLSVRLLVTFFFHFPTAAEQHSMQSNAQLTTEGEPPAKKKKTYTCSKCKKPGHRRNNCPQIDAAESGITDI